MQKLSGWLSFLPHLQYRNTKSQGTAIKQATSKPLSTSKKQLRDRIPRRATFDTRSTQHSLQKRSHRGDFVVEKNSDKENSHATCCQLTLECSSGYEEALTVCKLCQEDRDSPKRIRTNPWVRPSYGTAGCGSMTASQDQKWSTIESLSLSIVSASSGYGSHDSSPDTSVHWPQDFEDKSICCRESDLCDEDCVSYYDYVSECGAEESFDDCDVNGNPAPPHSKPQTPSFCAPPPPERSIVDELSDRLQVLRRKRITIEQSIAAVRYENYRRSLYREGTECLQHLKWSSSFEEQL